MDCPSRSRLSALALIAVATLAACASKGVEGTYALSEGEARVTSEMTAARFGNKVSFDIVQRARDSSQIVTRYEIDQTQEMHLVAVRDDFASFEHLQPAYDATNGHFKATIVADAAHGYHVYADSVPSGLGHQVFRFTLPANVGASAKVVAPSFTPSPTNVSSPPYALRLSTTSVAASTPTQIQLTIEKNASPATDLRPYLGAPAHVILIDTATLSYVHVHPTLAGGSHHVDAMEHMDNMDMHAGKPQSGPRQTLNLPALAVGTYKMWLQFRGGETLHTVPLTLVAR